MESSSSSISSPPVCSLSRPRALMSYRKLVEVKGDSVKDYVLSDPWTLFVIHFYACVCATVYMSPCSKNTSPRKQSLWWGCSDMVWYLMLVTERLLLLQLLSLSYLRYCFIWFWIQLRCNGRTEIHNLQQLTFWVFDLLFKEELFDCAIHHRPRVGKHLVVDKWGQIYCNPERQCILSFTLLTSMYLFCLIITWCIRYLSLGAVARSIGAESKQVAR